MENHIWIDPRKKRSMMSNIDHNPCIVMNAHSKPAPGFDEYVSVAKYNLAIAALKIYKTKSDNGELAGKTLESLGEA